MGGRPFIRRRSGAVGLALLLAVVPVVAPGPLADEVKATQFVQKLADDVLAVIRDKKETRAQKTTALRAIFLKAFDAERIGRFVLGRSWRTATDAQKKAYSQVFPTYVADIYACQFANYSGEIFTVVRTTRLSDTSSLVISEIRRPGGPKTDVRFRVEDGSGGMKIGDVTVEGASLIIAKRDEFASYIRREGLDSLIALLERRTGSTSDGSSSSSRVAC